MKQCWHNIKNPYAPRCANQAQWRYRFDAPEGPFRDLVREAVWCDDHKGEGTAYERLPEEEAIQLPAQCRGGAFAQRGRTASAVL